MSRNGKGADLVREDRPFRANRRSWVKRLKGSVGRVTSRGTESSRGDVP